MTPRIAHSLFALALVPALAIGSVTAQQPFANDRMPPALRETVRALTDSAAHEGLPSSVIEAKAAEGVAKGASAAAVTTVLRALMRSLRDARALLGPSATPTELAAASSALQSGVTKADIEAVRDAAGRRSVLMPLVVLTDLVTRGVNHVVASDAVRDLAKRGASDTDFTELRRAVAQDIMSGSDPSAAARTRAAARARAPAMVVTPPVEVRAGAAPQERTAGAFASAPLSLNGTFWTPAVGALRFGSSVTADSRTPSAAWSVSSWSLAGQLGGDARGVRASTGAARAVDNPLGGALAASASLDGWIALGRGTTLRAGMTDTRALTTIDNQAHSLAPDTGSGGVCVPPYNSLALCRGTTSARGYSTLRADLGWARGNWEAHLGGSASRTGPVSRALSVDATRWLTPSIGFTLGAASGQLDSARRSWVRAEVVVRPWASFWGRAAEGVNKVSSSVALATVEHTTGDRYLIHLKVARAKRVEIRSDGTGWTPMPTDKDKPDEWSIALHLSPGLHYVQVRRDGGEWSPPDGVPAAADGFLGQVGVLVI